MMNYTYRIAVIALICFFGALQTASAEDGESKTSQQTAGAENRDATGTGLRFVGFASTEFGQMVNYWILGDNEQRQNLLRTYVNFGVSKQATERLQVQASVEAKIYYNTFDQGGIGGHEGFFLPTMLYTFYIDRVYATYSLGDIKSPFLQFTLGYFPYKYNPDVRDLGEYLYRSGTYPAYIINNFDYPQARLIGLKLGSDLFGMLHQDLLLTTTSERPPFFDLNLGYVASVNIGGFLNIGVGGMYQSLWPASDSLTSPHNVSNVYLKNAVLQADGSYTGDTAYYTYAGLKLMARLSFDPKRIFIPSDGELGVFGNEDLKLYGEIAILGVKDYPQSVFISPNPNKWGYDTLSHKMPIMLGFNIPTFKVCDVLALEVEWYGCTYPLNYEYKDEGPIIPPVPVTPEQESDAITPTGGAGLGEHNFVSLDNWKWALYAKKSFKNGLYVVGQVACDHIRNETTISQSVDEEDALRTNRSWWWGLKVGYNF
jgi:hypothetical protein